MPRANRRPAEPELAEGMRLIDRYTILDRIGSGGMATIYRATDDRLDRVVCVKLLRTTLIEGSGSTSGQAVYQATYSHFLKEALALSKLQHPNTLRIYDFGYLDPPGGGPPGSGPNGAPFHVSEYLDGGNLETHVRLRGAISPEETLGILDGICGAAAEAHEHGIIHRDIKPSNILFARVRGDLVPKLADFGIAHSDIKKRGADEDASVSTVALFSPRWAAPEQLCGAPEGPRTDVYALGLLVAFMLAGRVLFGDEDVRVTFNDRVRSDALLTSRLAQLGFTGDVADVLTHAMTARPDDRVASPPELFERLRDALKVRPPSNVAPLRAAPAYTQEASEARPRTSSSGAPRPHHAPDAQPVAIEVVRGDDGVPVPQALAERVHDHGERRVRFVQVHEKLDLSFIDDEGGQVRVRVTMLPGTLSLNVKGLTCFVSRRGQRPTPALTVNADREPTGSIELVSTGRKVLGEITWSFGQGTPNGRVFVVDGRQLLVPYMEAREAVALMLSRGNDLVVMCRT
jgi:serine/threonine-protein kinase